MAKGTIRLDSTAMPLLAWIPGIYCISLGFGLQQTSSGAAKNNKSSSMCSNLLLIPVTIPNNPAIYDLTLKTCFIKEAVGGATETAASRKRARETWLISRREKNVTQVCQYLCRTGHVIWTNAEQLPQLTWCYLIMTCCFWELPRLSSHSSNEGWGPSWEVQLLRHVKIFFQSW